MIARRRDVIEQDATRSLQSLLVGRFCAVDKRAESIKALVSVYLRPQHISYPHNTRSSFALSPERTMKFISLSTLSLFLSLALYANACWPDGTPCHSSAECENCCSGYVDMATDVSVESSKHDEDLLTSSSDLRQPVKTRRHSVRRDDGATSRIPSHRPYMNVLSHL